MPQTHSPQRLELGEGPAIADRTTAEDTLTIKLLVGKSSRQISIAARIGPKRSAPEANFCAKIPFADISLVYFSPAGASASSTARPFAGLRVASPPLVDSESEATLALIGARYPGWLVLKFDVAGLARFSADLSAVPQLAALVSPDCPPELAGPQLAESNSTGGLELVFQSALSLNDPHQQQHMGAVARLLVLDQTGRVLSAGSAVCVDPARRLLLTAAHVVVSLKRKWSCLDPNGGTQILVGPVRDDRTVPRWRFGATVLAISPSSEHDLALLQVGAPVRTVPEAGLFPRDLGLRIKPISRFEVHPDQPRAELEMVGCRLGRAARLRSGAPLVLYGFPQTGGDLITRATSSCNGFVQTSGLLTAIKADFAADAGFSGGPVFELGTGALVGVLSCSHGQIDFPRPIELALELLQAADCTEAAAGECGS